MDSDEQTVISFTPKNTRQVGSITAGLRVVLWEHIQTLVSPNNVTKFQEFYHSVYPKWFFNALRRGHLDPETFQLAQHASLNDVVLQSDLDYFSMKYRIPLKRLGEPVVVTIEEFPIGLSSLTDAQQKRVAQLYTGDPDEYAATLDYVRGLYDGLGGSSNFLSVPPGIKTDFIELFGSPFNTRSDYCSAFGIEKELFGSLGSFFEYELESGTNYIANPPFDEQLMEDMVRRLDAQLAKTTNVTVVVTIPDWQPPFAARDLLDNSPHRKSSCALSRQAYNFYDYRSGNYISVCFSRLYVLSNDTWNSTQITATKLADKWAAEVKKANRR